MVGAVLLFFTRKQEMDYSQQESFRKIPYYIKERLELTSGGITTKGICEPYYFNNYSVALRVMCNSP